MSCSTKLTIYGFLAAAFFPGRGALVVVSLYLLGIALAVVTALVAGFMAKETVVSTISELFGSTLALASAITPLAAASLLVFCLLYTPCAAAVAAIRRELGTRWSLGIVVLQCAVAWVAAFAVRLAGLALGLG